VLLLACELLTAEVRESHDPDRDWKLATLGELRRSLLDEAPPAGAEPRRSLGEG